MKRVLVTGGGRGVGAAIVTALVEAGFAVDFTYRASSEAAEKLITELTTAHPGAQVTARHLDLSDLGSLEIACGEIEGQSYFGLVHNAGQPYDALAAMMAQDKAEAAMQVNFWSFTLLAAKLVRQMMRAKDGRVAVIGSVTAERGNQGNAAYAASKAALLGYVRTLAVEVASRNITVNYVAPGFIDTDMISKYAKFREKMESQIPANRFATPDDIAGIVGFLMSPGAAYITGAYLPVDGGLTAAIGIHR
jgi:3-oxoacyl-[acyl-carrier protein] reductase